MIIPARKAALVTGGARRVGKAIVLALADAGFDVMFTYFESEEAAKQTADEARSRGARCEAVCCDLTDPANIAPLLQTCRAVFSQIDLLVNNASVFKPGSIRFTDEKDAAKMWAVHVMAPMLLCQGFEMPLRSSRGCVINMVDLLAEKPWPDYLAYCASKAGLWNLTLSLARALSPEVRVNGIAPGVVDWPNDFPREDREKYLKRVPLARAGTPEDVAKTVLFLCNDSPYITGQIIRLDGGRSIA